MRTFYQMTYVVEIKVEVEAASEYEAEHEGARELPHDCVIWSVQHDSKHEVPDNG